MPTEQPDLSGLVAAIRLKTALLQKLAVRPSAEWPDHLETFISGAKACDLQDTTALLVLLADLKEEIRVFIGLEAAGESGMGPHMPPVAAGVSSREDMLTQFRLEAAEWLGAPAERPRIVASVVERLTRLINEHYSERLTLEALAAAVGRSKRHIAALFRRQTGQTLHGYLTRVRVHQAAALIREGEKIEAVSLMVGYRSKKNFYRHFKRQIGVTPIVYRTALLRLAPLSDREPTTKDDPENDTKGQTTRRWLRKQVSGRLDAQVATAHARIVDMSYGGLRLEIREPGEPLPEVFDVTVPTAGITLKAHCVWKGRTSATDELWGAVLVDTNAAAISHWREFVDSVP